jgi:dihydrofolate synthase/folylpolyglutamate synthase
MKPGVPAVVGDLLADAMAVVEDEAARYGTRLIRVGREIAREVRGLSEQGGLFTYRGLRLNMDDVEVGLPGEHQIDNAVTALAAVEVFADSQQIALDEGALREGLRSVRFAGRIEVMQHDPTVILDGAHNEEKIEALVATLRNLYRYERLILVLGMLESKNAEPIVRTLASLADRIITTAPSVKGKPAIPADTLAATAREIGTAHVVADGGPLESLQQALREARPRDLVVVTGSLYLIGEVRSHWHSAEAIVERRTMFPNSSP